MKESLFIEYVKKIFPKLQTIIEKVNGKRGNKLTYLHKTMLRKEYSADQKWESASVNTTYVSADMVAMDSPLPAKNRDSIAHANGTLPKVGMKKILRETQINAINIMKAQGASFTSIANKLTNDPVACSVGIDEKNEANFLTALSNGIVIVEDENNTGTGLRINFNYMPENCFGVEVPNFISYDDIKNVLSKADADGNSITTIMLALSTYNAIRQTQWAKELVANYRGQTVVEGTKLPVPTASLFDEAFADDNNGIKFLKVDRTVISEKNGKRKPYKPWNANKIIFLTTEEVGALVWGTLAEKTNPVSGVVYSTVDEYKLISKYSKNDPLQEFTSGQALVLPVIENVDQIYSLDITDGQLVDTEAESSDTGDEKITVWGQAYKKPEFVTEYNKIRGSKLAGTIADDKLIAAVNKLSDAEEAALKAAVETHKAV
ncbi:hypothetical protein MUN53_14535 [Parabacteroides sp. AGMB00274]|uniref:Phage capsid protein n=1 Tax=Parabacteroides faecalis TaxID=2924040 RepID=A0ABT0C463_9BACT|nr:hypothetical protein [Parabacteroides faecalis]MCJ2381807.1 hypothetical protein [Parabacteroides faecalis]